MDMGLIIRTRHNCIALVLGCALGISLSACGGTYQASDPRDPYENFNRKIFTAHLAIDRHVVKPAATGYSKVPEPIRRSLGNFLDNLRTPPVLVNDLLQGEWRRAGITLARFMMNTTVGVGGLFDPAARFGGLPDHSEDFGQTLAIYGVPEGPYAFTPIVGPTPPRHFAGVLVDIAFDPITYSGIGFVWTAGRTILTGLDARTNALTTLDEIEKSSLDFYASLRSLYYQNKQSEIDNGIIDLDDLPVIDFEDE